MPRHQRVVEAATTFGCPAFLRSGLLMVALWMLPNFYPEFGLITV